MVRQTDDIIIFSHKTDGSESCFFAGCLLPSLSERLQTVRIIYHICLYNIGKYRQMIRTALICRRPLRMGRPRGRCFFPSLMRPRPRGWCTWDRAAFQRTRRRHKRISGRLRYICGHFPCLFMLPSCRPGDSLFYYDAFFIRFYYDSQMSSSPISPYRLYMDSIFLYCILLPAS